MEGVEPLSPPFVQDYVPEYGSASRTKSPATRSRPLFGSPHFRAGHTPRYVNDEVYDAVAQKRSVGGVDNMALMSPGRSPSPSLRDGKDSMRQQNIARNAIDVTTGEGQMAQGEAKNRTLFEIQHMLRGRSAEDLVAIKRILRGNTDE